MMLFGHGFVWDFSSIGFSFFKFKIRQKVFFGKKIRKLAHLETF